MSAAFQLKVFFVLKRPSVESSWDFEELERQDFADPVQQECCLNYAEAFVAYLTLEFPIAPEQAQGGAEQAQIGGTTANRFAAARWRETEDSPAKCTVFKNCKTYSTTTSNFQPSSFQNVTSSRLYTMTSSLQRIMTDLNSPVPKGFTWRGCCHRCHNPAQYSSCYLLPVLQLASSYVNTHGIEIKFSERH